MTILQVRWPFNVSRYPLSPPDWCAVSYQSLSPSLLPSSYLFIIFVTQETPSPAHRFSGRTARPPRSQSVQRMSANLFNTCRLPRILRGRGEDCDSSSVWSRIPGSCGVLCSLVRLGNAALVWYYGWVVTVRISPERQTSGFTFFAQNRHVSPRRRLSGRAARVGCIHGGCLGVRWAPPPRHRRRLPGRAAHLRRRRRVVAPSLPPRRAGAAAATNAA